MTKQMHMSKYYAPNQHQESKQKRKAMTIWPTTSSLTNPIPNPNPNPNPMANSKR